MQLADQNREILALNGISRVGFSRLPDGPDDLPSAVSIVVPLSDAVLDEIDQAPTFAYYHHYRTVNACIDRLLLQVGLLLQQNGYRYMPVAASQSLPEEGLRSHRGLYSHKKAAVAAGLGAIGKSTLFLDFRFGARVRLGTLFTDAPLPSVPVQIPVSPCEDCDRCVRACPAGAITGIGWQVGLERDALLDADACNRYMRDHFMKIGRGSVCGICVRVCPFGLTAPVHHEEPVSNGTDR